MSSLIAASSAGGLTCTYLSDGRSGPAAFVSGLLTSWFVTGPFLSIDGVVPADGGGALSTIGGAAEPGGAAGGDEGVVVGVAVGGVALSSPISALKLALNPPEPCFAIGAAEPGIGVTLPPPPELHATKSTQPANSNLTRKQ